MKGKKPKKRKPAVTTKRVQATEDKPFTLPDIKAKPEEDQTPWEREGVTKMQLAFVEHYCSDAAGNASRAAALAGYSTENTNILAATASRMLRFVNVKAAIARRLASANITPEWVKETTAALAASNMGSFLALREDGEPEIDWQEAQRVGAFVQIRKFKEKGLKIPGATGEAAKVEIIERTIETHNPSPHLNLLARMLGLVTEAGQAGASVTVNVTQISDDDLVRIATSGRVGSAPAPSGTSKPDCLHERG